MLQTFLYKKVFSFVVRFFSSQHFIYFLKCFFHILISFQLHRYLLILSRLQPQQVWGFRRSRIWFEAWGQGSNPTALLGASNTTAMCEKTTKTQLEQGKIQHEILDWIQIQQVVIWISKDFSEGDFWLRSFQHHLSIYLSNYLPTNLL